jgi:hypothetical protein
MTVKELIKSLQALPENYEVFVADRKTEFTYGLANSVYVKSINMCEEPGGEVLAREKVVVIDEE